MQKQIYNSLLLYIFDNKIYNIINFLPASLILVPISPFYLLFSQHVLTQFSFQSMKYYCHMEKPQLIATSIKPQPSIPVFLPRNYLFSSLLQVVRSLIPREPQSSIEFIEFSLLPKSIELFQYFCTLTQNYYLVCEVLNPQLCPFLNA